MGRRVPLRGAVLIAATLSGALPAVAVESDLSAEGPERIRLACSGKMIAGGAESTIAADGMIDLASAAVMGFGIGSARIVVVTPSTIGFDSGDSSADRIARVSDSLRKPRREPPTVVQGTIDRQTGAVRVSVRSTTAPDTVLIAMALDCGMEPALD